MNRPGINISMFGVFTTHLTVFVKSSIYCLIQKASYDDRSHNLVSKEWLISVLFLLSLRICLPFWHTPRSAAEG